MDRHEYQRMYDLETTYWWHVGRIHVLRSLLDAWLPPGRGRRILDFGCGTGSALGLLTRYGSVTAADDSEIALDYARARTEGVTGVTFRHVATEGELPFPDGSFDLVTALDVLEHLDDDHAGLSELNRVLAPGGTLVVFVPAYRFLWSEHDEALGHRRRYVASDVHSRMNRAGFHVLKRSYTISFSFPLITGYRVFRGLFPSSGGTKTSYVMLPGPINRLFVAFLRLESALLRFMNLPFGTSIAAVGRKAG